MIGKAELTQAIALMAGATNQAASAMRSFGHPIRQARGKYGRNKNRTCKLLRRIKTTC